MQVDHALAPDVKQFDTLLATPLHPEPYTLQEGSLSRLMAAKYRQLRLVLARDFLDFHIRITPCFCF